MKEDKMAELSFEAPLAKFDGDEWNDFHDFHGQDEQNGSLDDRKQNGDSSSLDNFGETFSGSLEDLVNTFDEKITKCFGNYEADVDKLAPVQVRTQDEVMNDCEVWWTITGNFGNILPINWSQTRASRLQQESLSLKEREDSISPNLDLSDDDELQQALDMHSLIISSGNTSDADPIISADDVINEIEGIMEEGDSPPPPEEDTKLPSHEEILHAASAELAQIRAKHGVRMDNLEESLKNLSRGALSELLEELEGTIREYSQTLVTELALRDELEFEKELKNQFISSLLSVQKKRRDHSLERRRTPKQRAAHHNTYLTTVIPYHAGQGVPSNEHLQIFVKILRAIDEDSPTVPGLLTDYILKVLCPTS